MNKEKLPSLKMMLLISFVFWAVVWWLMIPAIVWVLNKYEVL